MIIKPCPFCGEMPKIATFFKVIYPEENMFADCELPYCMPRVRIECLKCGYVIDKASNMIVAERPEDFRKQEKQYRKGIIELLLYEVWNIRKTPSK